MNEYIMYGLKIVTDFTFRQLVPYVDDGNEYPEVTVMSTVFDEETRKIPAGSYMMGENRSYLCNKTMWIVVENGNSIRYEVKPDGILGNVNAYLIGWGMSLLAHQRGMMAIHCGAVANEEGAILIAGNSGAGKSTMTTAFLERGYRLMVDDMAFVETKPGAKETLAYPAFPYQKLCRNVVDEKGYNYDDLIYIDEDKDKFLVPYRGEFKTEAVPIKGFIMLAVDDCESVEAEEVKGLQKMHVVANNLFLRNLLGKEKYSPRYGEPCLKMAANVPIAYVCRPKEGNTTGKVIETVMNFVEKWN